jgi:hypothetical protein
VVPGEGAPAAAYLSCKDWVRVYLGEHPLLICPIKSALPPRAPFASQARAVAVSRRWPGTRKDVAARQKDGQPVRRSLAERDHLRLGPVNDKIECDLLNFYARVAMRVAPEA